MALTVLLEFTARPDVDSINDVLRSDLPLTASFPGNEGTEVLTADTEPGKFYLLTRWSDAAAYDAYVTWRQSPEGATRLAEIAAGPPSVRHFSTYIQF